MRIVKWTALAVVGLLFVFAAVVVYGWLSRVHAERVQAKTWHLDFGDQVSMGGHWIQLPSNWWAKPIDSDGTITMRNVDESLLTDSECSIIARPVPHKFASNEDILRELSLISHSDSTTQKSVIDLQSRGMALYCSRELFITHEFEDFCYAANFSYELRCVGRQKSERECEAILQTLN